VISGGDQSLLGVDSASTIGAGGQQFVDGIASGTVISGGTLQLFSQPAANRQPEQIAKELVKKTFPDTRTAYQIPNTMVGYQPGYGGYRAIPRAMPPAMPPDYGSADERAPRFYDRAPMPPAAETTTQIYRVWIKATPEAVWDAITSPEWTDRYGYGGLVEYGDLTPGTKYRIVAGPAMVAAGYRQESLRRMEWQTGGIR